MNLFIDTSFNMVHLALLDNKGLISSLEEKQDNTMSDNIFLMVTKLLDGKNIDEVKCIYVAIGPGSFTGVRIGVTIAKVFAHLKNIKLIPISSLEVLASTIENEDFVKVYMDARNSNVFGGVYDKNLNLLSEEKHMPFNTLKNMDIKGSGEYISYSIIDEDIIPKNPVINYLKIVKKHENDKGVNPHELVPKYLKLTEAERNLVLKNDK